MAGLNLEAKAGMSKASARSQVTMLLIIGLLLFIVVSLVLYLSKSAIKKNTQQSIKKVQETALETNPIKEFVAKCLDKLTKDSLVLLGSQGGVIYKGQGGVTLAPPKTSEGMLFVKYNNYNVSYNIMPPSFAAAYDDISYSSNTNNGDYPWKIFPYTERYANEKFEGYFGISYLPPINSSEGPHSFQDQMESFINNNMAACANFNIFKEQGINVAMKKPNTTVIIGSGDISVKSKIPITITDAKTKESSQLSEFSTNVNVRLKEIYFFAKNLIRNDTRSIKFDMGNAENRDFMTVAVVKNEYPYNDETKAKADIIIITDQKSLVNGRQFQYIFARKNRAPALYYIINNVVEFDADELIDESKLLQGYQKNAEDPDEDQLSYSVYAQLPGNPESAILDQPSITFRVEVADGALKDWQEIFVKRK